MLGSVPRLGGGLLALALLLPPRAIAQAPARAPAQEDVPLATRLLLLARDAKDSSDKRRVEAWDKLVELGQPGVEVLLPIVRAKLDRDRAALEEKLGPGPVHARAKRKVEEALAERRKEALACIFDRKRYPDADHGRVGQPEVDRLVACVSEVYDHPTKFARAALPEIDAAAHALEDDLAYFETCGGKLPDELQSVAKWMEHWNDSFTVDQLAIPPATQEWNVAVAKYDAEDVLTSADAEELACMNATNAYRRKMGLRVLEIDERLVRAARKHSIEMRDLDYFAHDSPNKENASFGGRCAREGYSGASGENIAIAGDGAGAFDGWYHSSGHHRNMLGGHAQFGVGGCDGRFTQDFGASSSLRGRKIEDPELLYLAKLKKLDPKSAESELQLALWCRTQKLEEKAATHARRALALDPENAKAHELLGEKKQNGQWVPGDAPRAGPVHGS